MQFSLWGNQSDLSLLERLTVEDARRMQGTDASHLARTSHKVVVNDLPWCVPSNDVTCQACYPIPVPPPSLSVLDHLDAVRTRTQDGAITRIDIILDNAGFELFNDLCLGGVWPPPGTCSSCRTVLMHGPADWLVGAGFCTSVRLHVKQYPWFVSDAMDKDITWMIEQLMAMEIPAARALAARWQVILPPPRDNQRTNRHKVQFTQLAFSPVGPHIQRAVGGGCRIVLDPAVRLYGDGGA